jgi:hypothetical protein
VPVIKLLLVYAALASPLSTKTFCERFEAPSDPKAALCTGKFAADPTAAADASAHAVHQCLEILNSAISRGHLKMDGGLATRCADARRELLADPRRSLVRLAALRAACAQAFTGRVSKGEVCESALECAAGLVCAGKDGGPPGTCVEPKKRGALCSSDAVNGSALAALFGGMRSVCGSASHCAGTVCAKDLNRGAPCIGDGPSACGGGLRCVRGLCAEDQLGLTRERCGKSSDCAAGLRCVTGACAKAAAAGSACAADADCAGVCRKNRCESLCGSP